MTREVVVLFDTTILQNQQTGGISRYFAQLIRALPEHGVKPRLVAPIWLNQHLGRGTTGVVGFPVPAQLQNRVTARVARVLLRASDALCPLALPHDVLHHTFYRRHRLHSRPSVVTVHDMIPELLPEHFPAGTPHGGKLDAALAASLVLAVSHTTRRDLVRLAPELEGRTVITPLAVDTEFFRSRAKGEPQRRLLFVGQRGGYKNFALFSEAVIPLLRMDRSLHVVCLGGGTFSDAELLPFRDAGVLGQLRHENPSDEALPRWYRGSLAFVFPSLYEGFGLPILEALASGCPVAASRTDAFVEVADEAAEYFEPRNPESIREALWHLIDNGARREDLRRLGASRLDTFSWRRTAALTAAAYRRVVEAPS